MKFNNYVYVLLALTAFPALALTPEQVTRITQANEQHRRTLAPDIRQVLMSVQEMMGFFHNLSAVSEQDFLIKLESLTFTADRLDCNPFMEPDERAAHRAALKSLASVLRTALYDSGSSASQNIAPAQAQIIEDFLQENCLKLMHSLGRSAEDAHDYLRQAIRPMFLQGKHDFCQLSLQELQEIVRATERVVQMDKGGSWTEYSTFVQQLTQGLQQKLAAMTSIPQKEYSLFEQQVMDITGDWHTKPSFCLLHQLAAVQPERQTSRSKLQGEVCWPESPNRLTIVHDILADEREIPHAGEYSQYSWRALNKYSVIRTCWDTAIGKPMGLPRLLAESLEAALRRGYTYQPEDLPQQAVLRTRDAVTFILHFKGNRFAAYLQGDGDTKENLLAHAEADLSRVKRLQENGKPYFKVSDLVSFIRKNY